MRLTEQVDMVAKAVIFLSLVVISGCVHNQYVNVTKNPNSEMPYDVSVGDTVKVITEEAASVEFQLTRVTDKSLIGEGIEIPYKEIQMLQVREIDSADTAATTGVVGLVLVNVVIIAALALAF